ncbi:MAG: hypothetical protein LIO86_15425 [Lachnospiraceae bacterium]|nr:hypothetical protein [Lachnospiraceae bacterium]
MAELSEYIAALTRDRDSLAANLQTMGVEADAAETFTSLVAKVLEIATGGVSLPVLSNPATASEILEGYEAIDQDGNVITGTAQQTVNMETGTGTLNYAWDEESLMLMIEESEEEETDA